MDTSIRRRARACRGWEHVVLSLALLASLVLRLADLDRFLTIDEPTWRERSHRFLQALKDRDLASIYQSEHPGVLTMWIGAGAHLLAEDIPAERADAGPSAPGVPDSTLWARRLVATTTWLGILGMYPLTRRLFGRRTALLAISLVALGPFYLAHSRVHHLDALLTTFSTLSALSLLVFGHRSSRWLCLVLAGLFAGLAIANKTPGLVLIPWAVAMLVASRARSAEKRIHIAAGAATSAVFCGVVLATIWAIWPALWRQPVSTLRQVVEGGLRQGLIPHEYSNFFWFARRPDPGPAFAPVAWLFRTTPLVLLGLTGMAVGTLRRDDRRIAIWVALLVLAYALIVTVSRKKFDRYLLPVFPLCAILAAHGLGLAHDRCRDRLRTSSLGAYVVPVLAALLAAGQLVAVARVHPYDLAYYNPLVGGARAAKHVLLYGWGEGLDDAARYLNTQADARSLHVASHMANEFAPFFVGKTTLAGYAPLVEPDYYVLYAGHVQRGIEPQVLEHFRDQIPEHTVRVGGLEYAWVYPNTFHREDALAALAMIGARADPRNAVVVLNVDAALKRYYRGDLTIESIAGPPRDDFALTAVNRVASERSRLWVLDFPDTYEESATHLDGILRERATVVDEIRVGEVSATCYDVEDSRFMPDTPRVSASFHVGEGIILDGYDLDPAEGGTISPRLYWRATRPVSASYKVFTHLVGPDGVIYGQQDSVPQGNAFPTSAWPTDTRILDDYAIPVSSEAPPGEYTIALGMYDLETMLRLTVTDALGRSVPDDRILIEGIRRP